MRKASLRVCVDNCYEAQLIQHPGKRAIVIAANSSEPSTSAGGQRARGMLSNHHSTQKRVKFFAAKARSTACGKQDSYDPSGGHD
jgi:hypothetical protein